MVARRGWETAVESPDGGSQRLQPADRIALVAVGGIVVSIAVWVIFSVVDALVFGPSVLAQLLLPESHLVGVRLSAIVLVLMATLVVQMLYASRVRIQEQLQREQRRIQQMYERSPDAMVVIDADGHVVYANPATQELAGMSPAEAAGLPCHSAIWGLDQPCDGCPLPEIRESLEMRTRTLCDDFNGFERWLQQIVYPVLDDAGIDSFVELVRDTTRLHLAEEELRMSRRETEPEFATADAGAVDA